MAVKVKPLLREFSYNGMKIPDPNPSASVELAVRSLAGAYPELASAKIEPGRVHTNGSGQSVQVFNLRVVLDAKG
jgi:PRTRC genetic system protein C